jgi:hypothetical protein
MAAWRRRAPRDGADRRRGERVVRVPADEVVSLERGQSEFCGDPGLAASTILLQAFGGELVDGDC